MRNLILFTLFFFLGTLQINAQLKYIYSGKLSETELIDLKKYLKEFTNSDLDSLSMLSIHYIQPVKYYCHYSKYTGNSKESNIWFARYYKDNSIVFPKKSKIITSFYEEFGKRKFSKKDDFFYDENHFFHKLIKKKDREKSCECFISLNLDGKIMIKYGEVRPEEIKYFIKEITISK